jgi:hypothetical protein
MGAVFPSFLMAGEQYIENTSGRTIKLINGSVILSNYSITSASALD